MAIILRNDKGSALTYTELDGNFTDLNGRVTTNANNISTNTTNISTNATNITSLQGSRVTTSSYNAFTGSVLTTSSFNTFTSSVVTTSSYNAFTSSVVTTSSFNTFTSSVVTTSSFNTFTSSVVTTSSFNAFTASVITTGSSTAKQSITGSLTVSSSLKIIGKTEFTGSAFSTVYLGTSAFGGVGPALDNKYDSISDIYSQVATRVPAFPFMFDNSSRIGNNSVLGVRYDYVDVGIGYPSVDTDGFTILSPAIYFSKDPTSTAPYPKYMTILSDNTSVTRDVVNAGIYTRNGRNHVLTVTGSFLSLDGVSLGSTVNDRHFLTGSMRLTGSMYVSGLATASVPVTNVLMISSSGQVFVTASTAIGGSGTISGTGLDGYVAYWSGSTPILSSSVLYQSASKLGIGTQSPTYALHISRSGETNLLNVNDLFDVRSTRIDLDAPSTYISGTLFLGADSPSDIPMRITQRSNFGTFYGLLIGANNTYSGSSTNQPYTFSNIIGYNNLANTIGLYQTIIGISNEITASGPINHAYILGSLNKISGSNRDSLTAQSNQIIIGHTNISDAYTNTQISQIIIGSNNQTNGYKYSTLVGSGIKPYGDNQLIFGHNAAPIDPEIKEVWIGHGVMNENNNTNSGNGAGSSVSINVSRAYSGSSAGAFPESPVSSSKPGGSLTLNGGQGTGTGSAGDVIIGTAVTQSINNTTYHTLVNRVFVKGHTGNVGIGVSNPSVRLEVSGSVIVSGSLTVVSGSTEFQVLNTGIKIGNSGSDAHTMTGSLGILGLENTRSTLSVRGSGSINPIFTVQGSQGELFSVTDSLSGSLFSVNDISGLQILDVDSNQTVKIGNYAAPGMYTSTKITANTGITIVYSVPTASYDSAYFDYNIRSGSVGRVGQIMAMWSGSSVNYNEVSASSFGTTSTFVFGVQVTGSNMILSGSAPTNGWTVKTIVRAI